jgi:hypothetical protein
LISRRRAFFCQFGLTRQRLCSVCRSSERRDNEDSTIGFGTYHHSSRYFCSVTSLKVMMMNGLIYLIGLVVVIMFILSFLGLR